MFKFKKSALNEVGEKLLHDIGIDLRGKLREEIRLMGYKYSTARKVNFYEKDKIVGSHAYSIAVLDSGRVPGTYPPFKKIFYWVKYIKDNGAFAGKDFETLKSMTGRVMNKIKYEGIDATWFAKNVLKDFTS